MPDPTPALTQEQLVKIQYEYEVGDYKTISELAERYGITPQNLHSRIKRHGWDKKKEAMLLKAHKDFEKVTISEATEWINRVKERSKKDWEIIDSSIDGMVDAAGGIEPSELRSYIQARKILDDMSRRALGLADPTHAIDITSKGQSLGESLLSAISKLRESPDKPKLSEEDKQRILEAEIIDDDQV